MIRSFTLLGALLCTAGVLNAQNHNDSLAEFDEAAAIRTSISENYQGTELRVHLSQLKRRYINEKFNIQQPLNDFMPGYKTAVVAACTNEDFEANTGTSTAITGTAQVSGWTVTRGNNMNGNDNCNLNGCCTSQPSEAMLIVAPTGYTDAVIGSVYPIYSVFGSVAASTAAAGYNPQITSVMYGNSFVRVNSNINDFSLERISKSFVVSSSNALYRFAFIAVQSSGHACCDAGGFILRLTNATTNTFLSSVSYSAAGVSASCSSTVGVNYYMAGTGAPATSSSSGVIFNKWHVNYIDLTPYMGQTINVEVTAGDCTAGGHYAYAYFDSQCGPVEIEVNGQAGKNISCTSNATVSAPANLNSYQWNGPGGFSSTSASFTTTTAGVYSLTIPQNSPYQAIQKTLSLVISPASVTVTTSKPYICPGESMVLTGYGLTSYSWSSGSSISTASVSPTNTQTYTLTGTNADNCQGFAMVTVSVSTCTGIEKITDAKEIVLFPNPNNGEFALNVNKSVSNAEIVIKNALGQVVLLQTIQKGENKIKTKGLANGVYYYTILENDNPIKNGKLTME
jgi:hypothetical protein